MASAAGRRRWEDGIPPLPTTTGSRVAGWFADRIQPISIDNDEHPEIADAFHVRAIPDCRLLDMQGHVAAFLGYKTPEEVIAFFEGATD